MTTKTNDLLPDEIWKPIPGWENYSVSSTGKVLNRKSGAVTSGTPNSYGYPSVCLRMENGKFKNRKVHRLLMLAFVGPSDLTVNHIDGDKTNNNLDNLEYITNRANIHHYYKSKYPAMGLDKKDGKYIARIRIKDRIVTLGGFYTVERALKQREHAEKLLSLGILNDDVIRDVRMMARIEQDPERRERALVAKATAQENADD